MQKQLSQTELQDFIREYNHDYYRFSGAIVAMEYVLHYANKEDMLELKSLLEQELTKLESGVIT